MRAAYDGLSQSMKEKINDLSAYHSYEWSQKERFGQIFLFDSIHKNDKQINHLSFLSCSGSNHRKRLAYQPNQFLLPWEGTLCAVNTAPLA